MQKLFTLFLTFFSAAALLASTGVFSVSATDKVQFAPGNLQYQASTNTFRFAEHQYDYVGDASQGNVYANGVKCNNANISSTYSGWIDLFGWGTSGYNKKYPYMTSENASDYGKGEKDIAGTKYDWGVYNQIGSDPAGTWRTLTSDEWEYLWNSRPGASKLVGQATVNDVKGLILLPDDWVLPSELTFVAGTDMGFTANKYNEKQWLLMEAAGACFLPTMGHREGKLMSNNESCYWSSTFAPSSHAGVLYISSLHIGPDVVSPKNCGYSVRLVRTAPEPTPIEKHTDIFLPYDATELTPEQEAANPIHLAYPTAMQDKMPTIQCGEVKIEGAFSVSATTKVAFSPGNLQYQASTEKWRFAEHQYDYVGDAKQGNVYTNGTKCDNAKISSTYSGWIDLFGWGTSGYNNKYPYMTSTNYSDYGDGEKDIAGTNYDWGVYNQIGSDPAGTWRTLTKDEWGYLYCTRKNAADLWGHGTVNGVTGTILLPDDWVLPSGLSFVAGTSGMPNQGTYFIGSGNHFNDNIYTTAQWEQMEAAGACFLPSAGFRDGTTMDYVQTLGYYWSSSYYNSSNVYGLYSFSSYLGSQDYNYRYYGRSVRLVRTL